MKTLYTLILSILLLNVSAQSFDYFEHSPRWIESYDNGSDVRVPIRFYIEGDSLHNGILYHKLWANRGMEWFLDERTDFPRVQGLIRQDGFKIQYKGFIISAFPDNHQSVPLTNSDTFPNEFTLFDFGMQVGDTLFAKDLPTIDEKYNAEFYIMGGIDTTLFQPLPGVKSRVLFFSGSGGLSIYNYVEGIGSEMSFLASPIGGSVESSRSLSCYKNDSTDLIDIQNRYSASYPHETYPDCGLITSIRESIANKTKLYPTPSNGLVFFSGTLPTEIALYNVQGQQVLSQTNKAGIKSLNLMQQPKGLYFVQYQSHGNLHSQKIILE